MLQPECGAYARVPYYQMMTIYAVQNSLSVTKSNKTYTVILNHPNTHTHTLTLIQIVLFITPLISQECTLTWEYTNDNIILRLPIILISL